MHGSRKFRQRESNFDELGFFIVFFRVFFFLEGREDPSKPL